MIAPPSQLLPLPARIPLLLHHLPIDSLKLPLNLIPSRSRSDMGEQAMRMNPDGSCSTSQLRGSAQSRGVNRELDSALLQDDVGICLLLAKLASNAG